MTRQRTAIISAARSWIGTRYQHQASVRNVGCDCLGLLRGVWREVIGDEPEPIPPYPCNWMSVAKTEFLLDTLERYFDHRPRDRFSPGDVLIFRFRRHLPASHIGIAVTSISMVHAHFDACVAEVPVGEHWGRRLVAVLSFPDPAS